MCCQPPSEVDDSNVLYESNIKNLELCLSSDNEVIITGGEPTLIGNKLFDYVKSIESILPKTNIHILTNGRLFSDLKYLVHFAEKVKKNEVSLGIPIHSDNSLDHDIISGVKGSFYETVRGLQNLGVLGYNIELRIIIQKLNYKRLEKISQFIVLNLPFVSQVSFIGLEITGYAEKNFNNVYVEMSACSIILINAVNKLLSSNIDVRIYNIPLCLLHKSLWYLSCKSISNWKKTNIKECEKCLVFDKCCGVFSTSSYLSSEIHSIKKIQ